MVPEAFFQFWNPISVNLFTGLLFPILGGKKQHRKQKAVSFWTEYSSQEYSLYQSALNDLALSEKKVTGNLIRG